MNRPFHESAAPSKAVPEPSLKPLPPLPPPVPVTIGNGLITLALGLPERGMPEILAFGPFAADGAIEATAERAGRVNGMDRAVPAAVLLPAGGTGFFGWPALAGHRDGRDFVAEFADWSIERDGNRTTLRARDEVAALSLAIEIEVIDAGVLTMRTVIRNEGDAPYTLDRCMAATMPVGDGPGTLGLFCGMWGREFHFSETSIPLGLWLQESRRGRTSHDRFPGLFAKAGGTVAAIHLGWSGNHALAVDTLDDGRRLVHAGELFEPGEARLGPGETYASPKAFLTAAPTLEAAARRLRTCLRETVLAFPDPRKPRPVTFNTWEGNYFRHDPLHLLRQAEAAAALGIERFVLDDGWFGRRDLDDSSLGDWFVDARKYPEGLGPLVEGVRTLGMEFGIWFEPEMVNPDSDLFRAHPEWVLQVAGRPLLASRRQLVLDLSRPEVSDYLFERLDAVLAAHPIAYVKWDMNRDLTHPGGADGRAASARQTRAFYALLDRVRRAHPSVEIESCASGGGRADYGVLGFTHRLWTSDGTDAFERLEIQRGAALLFPPEIMGAHVSAVPNHQTGRHHTLAFRAVVALAYHFGVELDPLALKPDEAAELSGWVALHKRLRPLLHAPDAEFHLAPEDGRYAWGAASRDRVALFVAQGPQALREQPAPLRLDLAALAEGRWRIAACHPAEPAFIRPSESQRMLLRGETAFTAATLRRAGLALPMLRPESGAVLELERLEDAR